MLPSPIVYYSPIAIVTEDEEKARKAKMSIIIERYKDRVSVLPKHITWTNTHVYKYEGFWYRSKADFSVEAVMASQDNFQALPTDVFLASHPKSGTTWLKALAFAITNRKKFRFGPTNPLLTISPHDCVPFIESEAFLNNPSYANGLMAAHIPYTSLPKSIISSGCRIVFICRNPKDVIISFWHFMNKLIGNESTPTKLEDAFEYFIKGITPYGSFWDSAIGYLKASRERPDKVLFLNYEDMIKDVKKEVKKLAEFIGYPFTEEEEAKGAVEEIIQLCSFEKLSNVNTKANDDREDTPNVISNAIYFRKGIVGDSVNHLTPEMIQILDKITREKYEGLPIPI